MNGKEYARYGLTAFAVILGAALLCYDSPVYVILLLPFVPYYIRNSKNRLRDERKWRLNLQFRDSINCVSSALESGYSIENAISEAYNDMKLTYPLEAEIMQEYRVIMNAIGNNRTIEEAFSNLAERSDLEDIKSFADIFATAKRTGGNIMQIIRSTAGVIHTRVELKRELKTIISSKKLEADIMKLIPLGLLVYLRIFSPGMVDALYGNTFGVAFMTVILVVYLILCKVSDHVVKIEF